MNIRSLVINLFTQPPFHFSLVSKTKLNKDFHNTNVAYRFPWIGCITSHSIPVQQELYQA